MENTNIMANEELLKGFAIGARIALASAEEYLQTGFTLIAEESYREALLELNSAYHILNAGFNSSYAIVVSKNDKIDIEEEIIVEIREVLAEVCDGVYFCVENEEEMEFVDEEYILGRYDYLGFLVRDLLDEE